MQDQKDTKELAMRKKDRLWGLIALLILFTGALCFWFIIGKAPKAEWRNAYTKLPWEAAGVCIDEAEATWKSSRGDARMELRAYCYPTCRLALQEAEGKGFISIRMYDSQGTQMGDRVRIHYSNGKFQPVQSNSVQVTDTEASIRLEDGFKTADLYKLHQINEKEKLWTIEATCHPDGGEPEQLGHLSILPHDL